MYTAVRVVGVLAFGVLAWLLLGLWIPGASERFYLLVPPGALLLLLKVGLRPQWRAQSRRAALFLAGLALLCTAYAWVWAQATGVPLVWMAPEIVLATYFLAGAVLLTCAAHAGLRGLGRWLGNRGFGPSPAGRLGRVGRAVVADALPPLLLGILVLAYLLGALYVHRFKIPNTATPQTVLGRPYEDVEFVTADGLTIRGWFLPARETSVRTVVVCHGLGANRSMFLSYVKVCDALRANVLLFDFRAHGDSDGHTGTLGHREKFDVLAAVDYLRTRRPGQAREVIGLGISMGSAALLRAAAELERPLDAVIVDSGFASALDLTDSILAAFPAPLRPLLMLPGVPLASLHAGCWLPDVRPEDRIGQVRAPVLVVHSRRDPLIPSAHGVRLHARAVGPKSLLLTDTDGHCTVLSGAPEEYLRAVTQFVEGRGRPR